MIISADTLVELDEAIESHKANGWVLLDRRRHMDGTYSAVLERNEKDENQSELPLK